MKNPLFLIVVLVLSIRATAQPFVNTNINFPGVQLGGLDWGDFDNDGDLDLLYAGNTSAATTTQIFENKITMFSAVDPGIGNFGNADVMWCDFDNDGESDYLLTGNLIGCTYAPLVRNDLLFDGTNYDPVFTTQLSVSLQEMRLASVDWGDYDNDGDQDVAMAGYQTSSGTHFSIIYRNDNGVFVNIGAPLATSSSPVLHWIDYDNDLDLDLHLANNIYKNHNGVFSNSGIYLSPSLDGDADWGDYDNDGDMDLIISGDSLNGNIPLIRLYRNDITTLTRVLVNIPGIDESTTRWGDYDNDGDLDILVSGDTSHVTFPSAFLTEIYTNQGGNVFSPMGVATAVRYRWSAGRWVDYNNDGDLDFMITGNTPSGPRVHLYGNQLGSAFANTLPTIPLNTNEAVSADSVLLSWNKSTDNQTPQNGLTYNVYVGTSPSGVEILSPMSILSNGQRKEAKFGNTGSSNQWKLKNLSPGTYYWGAQAVDQIFAGSGFSPENSFVIQETNAPTPHYPYIDAINVKPDSVYRWYPSAGAVTYEFMVSSDSLFNTIIQHDSLVVDTFHVMIGLALNTTYFWKVRAKKAVGYSNWSYLRRFTTLPYFTELSCPVPGIVGGKSDFGDLDNDNDYDLLLQGGGGSQSHSEVWINNNGVFTNWGAGNFPFYNGHAAFGDYDNDNDLDFVINGGSLGIPQVYQNNSAAFSTFAAYIIGDGALAWGDYDNDGDLDVATIGNTLYTNNNGTFTGQTLPIPIIQSSSAEWGDYDNDNDLDLLITGQPGGSGYGTYLLRNDSSVFSLVTTGMVNIIRGTAKWGDYDSDGDLDIFMMGQTATIPYSWYVYRNDNGNFVIQYGQTDGMNYGDGEWGDYDNDGDLDLMMVGANKAFLYENNSGSFIALSTSITGVNYGSVNWVDVDNDHDLDLFITGENTSNGATVALSKFYINNCISPNNQPTPPVNLSGIYSNDTISFSWNAGGDVETPSTGLTYNFYLSPIPGTVDSMTPMADLSSGFRKVIRIGNANSNLSWKLKDIASGTYYWSVQSIDNCYEGSVFAAEETVTLIKDDVFENDNFVLNIYPNPTDGDYTIRYIGSSQHVTATLFTIDNQQVSSSQVGNRSGNNELRFSHRGLAPGTYILQLKTDQRTITRKIVFK